MNVRVKWGLWVAAVTALYFPVIAWSQDDEGGGGGGDVGTLLTDLGTASTDTLTLVIQVIAAIAAAAVLWGIVRAYSRSQERENHGGTGMAVFAGVGVLIVLAFIVTYAENLVGGIGGGAG